MRCADKLCARHPDRPRDELLDTIPEFLDEIIKAERREAGLDEHTPLPNESPFARAHGEQRFRRGYPPSSLPLDYGTISDVIGELAIEQSYLLDPKSYRLLAECIDKATAQAITEYFSLSRASGDLEIAEWVGSLGHELRNAVATALMAYTALRSGKVGIESRTSRVLERSLHRVETLVTQTLAAAHMRAGVAVHRTRIDIPELLDDVVASAFVERGIRLDVDAEAGLSVVADPHLLESAVSNLVQNALKFTRDQGRVLVRAAKANDDGVLVEVLDECGGLRDVNEAEVFGAFVRGETVQPERRKKSGKGVGLGLTITKQAIEAQGGSVRVRDRAPLGCTFTVWLPRA